MDNLSRTAEARMPAGLRRGSHCICTCCSKTTPVPVLTPDVRATAHGTAGFRATKFGRCSNRSLIRRSDITGLSSGQDLASGAWSSVGPAGPTPATQTATESDAAHSGVS